ncbi:MAG TPA: GNAT family protein [Rugosimonospora sp.]|nr:GNAT family protein [Rugosimonospora sp.]
MLRGEKVALRARVATDEPILHAELYDDVPTRSRADGRPWRPVAPGTPHSPFALGEPNDTRATFAVVELASDELAGAALLWDIDTHNRTAHLGLGLRPSFRGRGLGTDIVRVLCHYGFVVRGLRRLQVDTLADNAAMIGAATSVGFTVEGTLRSCAWVCGEYLDEVLLGLLVHESAWAPRMSDS